MYFLLQISNKYIYRTNSVVVAIRNTLLKATEHIIEIYTNRRNKQTSRTKCINSAHYSRDKDKEKGQKSPLSPQHHIKVNLWGFYISPQVHCTPHRVNTHFNYRESFCQKNIFSPRGLSAWRSGEQDRTALQQLCHHGAAGTWDKLPKIILLVTPT